MAELTVVYAGNQGPSDAQGGHRTLTNTIPRWFPPRGVECYFSLPMELFRLFVILTFEFGLELPIEGGDLVSTWSGDRELHAEIP